MGLVSYGVSGLLSTATVFGIAITVQDAAPFSGGDLPVIELRSGAGWSDSGAAGKVQEREPKTETSLERSPADPQGNHPVLELTSENSDAGQKRQKIKISLQVERPEDIRVKEGDRVLSGQILAEQTRAKRDLEAQRQQLQLSQQELALPLPPVPGSPEADFSLEEANVAAAQGAIASLQQAPKPNPRFIDPTLSAALDGDVREENWQLATKQAEAQGELNRAIAQLQAAKSQYAEQQSQHRLAQQQHQKNHQKQQIQLAQVQEKLVVVQRQLDGVGVVRSPYSGRIQRLRLLGQEGHLLKLELSLIAEQADEVRSFKAQ